MVALLRSDRPLTVRMIASELNLNHTTVHQILTEELTMKQLCEKFVPKNLTIEQKENRRTCVFIFWNGSKGTEIS